MQFNPDIALGYARAIARPRLVGCGEEVVVARQIADRLSGFGYRVERQPFEFSTAPGIFIRVEILVSLLLIAATLGARDISRWASLAPAAALLGLILLFGPINRAVAAASLSTEPGQNASWSQDHLRWSQGHLRWSQGHLRPQAVLRRWWARLCLRLGSKYSTANLIARLPNSLAGANRPRLLLAAHYDSKSQRMPLVVRIGLFIAALAGSAVFALLTMLTPLAAGLGTAASIIGLVVILAGLPLLFLDVGNASPGAIDDASGVGVVMHLAECLARRPDLRERMSATILLTSAEEQSVMGAAAFVRRHEAELREQAGRGGVYLLNFDGVGVDGRLYLAGGRGRLGAIVHQACRGLGLRAGRFALPGALFDHMPFERRGFDALSLIAIGRDSWAVHTPRDSVDKLHPRGFQIAGQVAMRVIETLAEVRPP